MSLNATTSSTYSFRLRNSIEQEADSALSKLDDLIRTKGYEWLDDYMQGVTVAVAQGGRRNAAQAGSTLVNILKTPSRTPRLGTAKQTRTVLAKEKDKENRLRLANAQLTSETNADSRGLEKVKSNPRSILFASALTEHDSNAASAKPIRKAQPTVVKDISNPFIEPSSIASLPNGPGVIPLTSAAPTKSAPEAIVPVNRSQALSSTPQAVHIPRERLETAGLAASALQSERKTASPTVPATTEGFDDEQAVPGAIQGLCKEPRSSHSTPASPIASPELPTSLASVTYEISEQDDETSAIVQLTVSTQTMRLGVSQGDETSLTEEGSVTAGTTTRHDHAMVSSEEPQDSLSAMAGQIVEVFPSETRDAHHGEMPSTDDYSVPLKDNDVTLQLPSSPQTAEGTSVKSVFSPSAVTFAALPTRDLQRGRSIGASKHQRMTSHLVESSVPDVQTTVKTPGPAPSVAFPHPSENKAAISKAARDSKSGGTGAGSSWISRKVLAGSGGEDLRKSLAATKRPSTMDRAMEEESDLEADELQDDWKQSGLRASEAPLNVDRYSLVSKTPQPPHQARQTLGASTISRPTEQPQTNLSKMIADLQERRAVATFNASVTRATLPSLQLGRGAQGIASMGISSGLLGRAALQSSLDRTRNTTSQAPETDAFDVFDEKPSSASKMSEQEASAVKHAESGGHAEPSTTEELNQAVDEILRKISTERQMQQVPEHQPAAPNLEETARVTVEKPEASHIHLTSQRRAIPPSNDKVATTTITPTVPTRAEEREVEELTKRTHALSVAVRDSEGFAMPGAFKNALTPARMQSPTSSRRGSSVNADIEGTPDALPASTTPVNSPPKVLLYRPSHSEMTQRNHFHAQPRPATNLQKETLSSSEAANATRAIKQLPSRTQEQHRENPVQFSTLAPKGLSESQALSVDGEESDDSMSEDVLVVAIGDKRFDEDEVLADEVAKLAEPLNIAPKESNSEVVESDSDAESIEEVESNDADSRAPSRSGTTSLTSSTATNALSASTTAKAKSKGYSHTPANIARLIDGQKAPAGPINSILKAQQRKAEDEARRAKRVANKEAIDKRKQDERKAKLDEMRTKEEVERKARLERLRKQKTERERLEKKRQEQEAARAAESFCRDRAVSVDPGGSKTTLNQSQGTKKLLPVMKSSKPAEAARVKEVAVRAGTLHTSTSRPPSRVSAVPAEIKGGAGAMRPPISRTNTNPGTVASQSVVVNNAIQVIPPRETHARTSVLTKQPPPLTTSINGNTVDVRAVRPNKKPSIILTQKTAPHRQRESTMKPTRDTMKPGMNVAEFQRMIALGGTAPANMRSEDIELSDIGSDFGYESDSSESDKGEIVPSWAQSPALRKAAAMQEKINPSHLFGVMPEFKMESVFDPKAARRPRSSSANWTGQDRLTEQEKLEYAKKMGYKSIDDLALLAMNVSAAL